MINMQWLISLLILVSFGFHLQLVAVGLPSDRSTGDRLKHTLSYPFQSRKVNELPEELKDEMHGVKMGILSDVCDNAVDNLDMDWDGSPENYTCYHPKNPLPILETLNSIQECYVPKGYFPKHVCMSEKIHYKEDIPTYGNHRPLWPVYGEYLFVPPQRWLHTLEHGGIVMLYHPCAEPLEVEHLRILLKNCLRRYVISPSKLVPANRPLVLLSWGCKLQMNYVETEVVTKFIKNHALQAPEGSLPKEGQYKYKLMEQSFVVPGSTYQDSHLCPNVQIQ